MWNHFASKYSTHEGNFNVCISRPFPALSVGQKGPTNVPVVFCPLDHFAYSFNGKSESNIDVKNLVCKIIIINKKKHNLFNSLLDFIKTGYQTGNSVVHCPMKILSLKIKIIIKKISWDQRVFCPWTAILNSGL